MTSIHPRHHVRRRNVRTVASYMKNVDRFVSKLAPTYGTHFHRGADWFRLADVVVKAQGLGMSACTLNERWEQALKLEAAQVSDELVNIICKVSTQGVLMNEDIMYLANSASRGNRP